jgi:predicted TIM-barrel fold metal-dependent hydrolase
MQQLTRRDFVKSTATLAGASVVAASHTDSLFAGKKKVTQQNLPICDTHLHLWDLTKFKLPWLSGDGVKRINRSFVMKDYRAASDGHNVARAVYMEVNVAGSDQVGEAEYVIDLCKRDDNPMAGAVIGGSPQSADFKAYIDRVGGSAYVKGVRTVLHDADRPTGMCLQPQFVENVQLLGKLGKRFDLCMRPDELLDGAKLVDKCPDTKFVVDHCGNLSVQNKDAALRAKWEKGIRELADRPNVVCKISGIIVTADRENWTAADLAPNMNFCMDTFGEDRVMFAGDWPVCTLTAPFGDWATALKTIVNDRPLAAQKKLFHDNAVKFYELA